MINYITVIIIIIKHNFQPKNQHKWPCCWITDFVFKLNCFADIYANKPFALLKSKIKKSRVFIYFS